MTPNDSGRHWRILLWFLVALVPAGVAIQPRIAEDTWWHLRVGEGVVAERAVPRTDTFSQVGRRDGVAWIAYSWLFDLGLYGCYSVGGLAGVVAARYVLSAATIAVLAWWLGRRAAKPWAAIATFAVAVPAYLSMLVERPWHMTIIGVVLTLHAIDRLREGDAFRRVVWLMPLYVIWANVHIQFVLGLGLLGLAAIVASGERRSGKPAARSLGILAIACAGATLFTPYYVRLYGVVWDYATQTVALRSVVELRPPSIGDWWTWPLIALGPVAIVALAVRRFPWWETALFVVGVIFALRMQRDGWFGVLAAASIVVRAWGVNLPAQRVWPAIAATLAAFLLARMAWEAGLVDRPTLDAAAEREYPVRAAKFVRETRPTGPLFNPFDWGGYLIWELRDYPVSIDGRTNLYGDDALTRSVRTWNAEPGWEADPELTAAGVIVAPHKLQGKEVRLMSELRRQPERWRVVYEDDVAVVFVRR